MKIAIIGTGNMGSAIAASLSDTQYQVICTASSEATLHRIREELPYATVTADNSQAVTDADIVILAVKPRIAQSVLAEIKAHIRPGTTVLSIIAGLTVATLATALDAASGNLSILRVIPNTAIRYRQSVTFIAPGNGVGNDAIKTTVDIFSLSGSAFVIDESQMSACTALASCGIAYFLRFIRAAAEGAVELGLKPDFATRVAALTAAGAASLLAEGAHPEAEIDKVTTPGGLTIKGLNALEDHGFASAVIAALRASV